MEAWILAGFSVLVNVILLIMCFTLIDRLQKYKTLYEDALFWRQIEKLNRKGKQ